MEQYAESRVYDRTNGLVLAFIGIKWSIPRLIVIYGGGCRVAETFWFLPIDGPWSIINAFSYIVFWFGMFLLIGDLIEQKTE